VLATADIHAQDKNGTTPLHRTVRTPCAAAVKCLLDAGADGTIQNKPGSAPFHLAVQNTGRVEAALKKAKAAQEEIIQVFWRTVSAQCSKTASASPSFNGPEVTSFVRCL
jgi:ankyrin repeat protein